MTEEWRVLRDPGLTATPGSGPTSPTATLTAAAGRPLWPLMVVAIAVVVAAAIWLMATGTSGSAVTVNAAVQARASGAKSSAGADSAAPSAEPRRSSAVAIVEVNGAVKRPGVYRLAEAARIADAIAAAGGYSASVDSGAAQALNLAAKVADGQQVHVPKRGEGAQAGQLGQQANAGSTGGGSADVSGPVNINTATSAQLEALPGIGPATAAKIIAARAATPFATIDELRGRKIVGAATFEKIRGLVVVR